MLDLNSSSRTRPLLASTKTDLRWMGTGTNKVADLVSVELPVGRSVGATAHCGYASILQLENSPSFEVRNLVKLDGDTEEILGELINPDDGGTHFERTLILLYG